ncbi:hypothetical protein [Solemya velum gill symbiont]|uniref:Sulfur globule protein CV1 n=1 Tax=Solemya velum gill symbiont TaxID=2340 RepID=A0A1T2DKN6_SOVGS|nr:hypothetical protein [Solemya velum gill symbiont]OOY34674.1 hypothetical protein BOV88_08695 [Solemya velum gill symbiont]OOY37469.1 hypothetical protein BOV89_07125 [Solemya velum gill symbiont]OOY47509.1 hypothetical protein BOV92_01420 [Solemya velum gill symbiont]OOY47657.1 hypothetical protein BOV93_05765 [Solemya velum gill symbiont]OOY51222.1 hypothetical protein BOV94_05590 [Solemya velum gill symbiont]
MKKIITAAAIAAIMGASSAAVAEWDMPFFDDNDSNYYNDNRWNNDGYGYGRGDGPGPAPAAPRVAPSAPGNCAQ